MDLKTAFSITSGKPRGSQWADVDSETERMDFHGRAMDVQGHIDGTQVVEMALDPELLATFCRRSRRRLRDLQTACQASVKLDRSRGVLRISGSESSIQAARRQLASLTGPRRDVPAAVWAELMRTRKMTNSAQATVARLQEESGCRIHIERSQQEVRLFGPGEAVAIADRLLEELAEQVKEEFVPLPSGAALSSQALEALAHRCRITLRMEDTQVVVLGMASAVAEGAEEVRRYLANPASFQEDFPVEQRFASGEEVERDGIVTWEGASTGIPAPSWTSNASAMATLQVDGSKPVHSKSSDRQSACCAACCPTCGASRFCSGCGAPTGFEPKHSRSFASRTTASGSDHSLPPTPPTPPSLDASPGPHQQWYQFMPQQMAPQMQQAPMGEPGMVPVCMVPQGGTTMMPAGMIMVPAGAVSTDGSWLASPDGGGLWVPPQQQQRDTSSQSSLPNLPETWLAYT